MGPVASYFGRISSNFFALKNENRRSKHFKWLRFAAFHISYVMGAKCVG